MESANCNKLISALAWVSRGYAKNIPKEYELNEEDVEEIQK